MSQPSFRVRVTRGIRVLLNVEVPSENGLNIVYDMLDHMMAELILLVEEQPKREDLREIERIIAAAQRDVWDMCQGEWHRLRWGKRLWTASIPPFGRRRKETIIMIKRIGE